MFDQKRLDAMLAPYTPGHPLAQAFYKDQQLFEADLALIWQR
jgi:Rieske 2Fe-2S family protein